MADKLPPSNYGSSDASVGVVIGCEGATRRSCLGFWLVKGQEPVNGERRAQRQGMAHLVGRGEDSC